jgi:glycosyltransferase involved in cell wall biosynthesis
MSTPRPLVSVVMPVFNAGRYLQSALDSISAQSFADFEFIAVNDGSTDNSLELLWRHALRDKRLRVLTRPNTGIVGALNEGLATAHGAFIARMDADDEAHPARFARQLALLARDPALVCIGSAVTFMDAAGHSVQSCPRPLAHAEIERALLGGDGGALIHPSVMLRTSAVTAVGGYRPKAQYLEDLDLFLRLARIGTLANHPESLLRYRVHAQSINFTQRDGRHALRLFVLRDAHQARRLPFDFETRPADADGHGDSTRHHREWAASALAYGSRGVAVSHGWRSVWLRPREAASWRALRYALTAPLIGRHASF